MVKIQTLSVLLLGGLISGCAALGVGKSEYSCPGGAEGVHCMSARQVYQATHSSDEVKPTSGSKAQDDENNTKIIVERTSRIAVPRIHQPLPIRTQASVMRIWMAPWEDDDGDLHADGFLYTEIEGRKWNLGERFVSPAETLSPLMLGTNHK